MKDKILLLASLFLFLNSCKNNDELGLTNQKKKWVYYDSDIKFDNKKGRFMTFLKFNKDGKCVNYFFNGIQYESFMNWEFSKKDSILKISDNSFLILKIYSDSILMKDLKYNKKVKMLNWNVLEK